MKKLLLLIALGVPYICLAAMKPAHVYYFRETQMLADWLKNYDWNKPFNTTEIRQLILNGADPNVKGKGKTLLVVAIKDSDMISFLLKYGANPNLKTDSGSSPLMLAVVRDSLATVELLVAHGADVHEKDTEGDTPLMSAVITNNLNMVKLLLELGAATDIEIANLRGWTPLYYARNSRHRNTKMIELLESYKKQKLK